MEPLSDANVLRLVQQHVAYCGWTRTVHELERESGVSYLDPGLEESRLLSLLRRTMQYDECCLPLISYLSLSRSVEELYHVALSSPLLEVRPPELDALLYEMGLVGEGWCLFSLLVCVCVCLNGTPPADPGAVDGSSVSVWDEATTDKTLVLGDGGHVKLATVNQLVRKLTSAAETDIGFVKCFLTTYQSFLSPPRLLAKLVDRFNVPANQASEADALKIKSRVVNVLKQWLVLSPSDFDGAMEETLALFMER